MHADMLMSVWVSVYLLGHKDIRLCPNTIQKWDYDPVYDCGLFSCLIYNAVLDSYHHQVPQFAREGGVDQTWG